MFADQAVQTTMQPVIPALNVLPEPILIGSLLMKPASTFMQPLEALPGGSQFTAGMQAISQKIESLSCGSDVAFIWMNAQF